MRRREFLMAFALVSIVMISARASARPGGSITAPSDEQMPAAEVGIKPAAEASSIEMPSVEPAPLVSKDKELGAAYFSTVRILSTANGCSRFFGGSGASTRVFKQLIGKVQKAFFMTPIGIQMSGKTINMSNATVGTEYRLFDKVTINVIGPFYRERSPRSSLPFPRIANFAANTNEARVLMLLHELGHVIKGQDGQWLLPNDGGNESVSYLNTQKINEVCGEQIKGLRQSKRSGDGPDNLASNTGYEAPSRSH